MFHSPPITLCLIPLKQGLSLNLELGWWPASLLFIFLSLPPGAAGIHDHAQLFYVCSTWLFMCSGDLNSDLHACATSTVPMESCNYESILCAFVGI